MTQTIVSVAAFLILLALFPLGIKWVQRRSPGGGATATAATRIVSAIAVGPHQRVVTIEVGPEGARVWLTLGVTAQSITCLHSVAAEPQSDKNRMPVAESAPIQS